jgi:hypothetical protein
LIELLTQNAGLFIEIVMQLLGSGLLIGGQLAVALGPIPLPLFQWCLAQAELLPKVSAARAISVSVIFLFRFIVYSPGLWLLSDLHLPCQNGKAAGYRALSAFQPESE